ncbi:MAG: sigma-54-dependent Fis family transcriptional regulator [Candidatus Riflebacteria bacterium]|nr:sigma-54-dependent Fis family transcriptional regulator [Candidatus Riflebacteria bacterium]
MRILIIEDDRQQATNLAALLETFGHGAIYRTDSVQGLALFADEVFDLTILDMRMPGIDGLTILKRALDLKPEARIVILTAYGTIESAVEAMKRGAFDFLVKPVEKDRLQQVLDLVRNALRLSHMAGYSAPTVPDSYDAGGFIAAGPAMRRVQELIRRVATLTTTVLIQGETGTGKELVARAIHGNSPRKDKPFVAVNCANLQGALLESELFGHEKGAFTGADTRKLGKFEVASGGTLFLDEVGEIPLELQAKLLRVLQEGEIERVGGGKPVRVDVRLVSATNRDLSRMIEQGTFRQDLYYRLNVFPLRLPPLRDRRDEIPALAALMMSEFATAQGRKDLSIESAALVWLKERPWPGNIRELKNVLERAAIIDEDGIITVEDLGHDESDGHSRTAVGGLATGTGAFDSGTELTTLLVDQERQAVIRALERTQGNVVAAARELGLPRRTMYDRLKKLGVDPSRFRKSD